MKQIFIFLIILIIANLSYGQSNCNCWDSIFESNGQDYNQEFAKLEKNYIDNGCLTNASPETYWALIDTPKQNLNCDLEGMKINPLFNQGFPICFESNSCKTIVYQKIESLNTEIASYESITPTILRTSFQKIFTKEDFKSIYARHYYLFSYNIGLNTELGLAVSLPDMPSEIKLIHPLEVQNSIRIRLTENDTLFFNDSIIKLEDLIAIIYDEILDSTNLCLVNNKFELDSFGIKRKYYCRTIYLGNDRKTTYDFYSAVYNTITTAYSIARDNLAIEEFGRGYKNLSSDRKELIRTILPVKIREVEPFK